MSREQGLEMSKNNNRTLRIALPLILVLLGLVVYQYGYLKVHSQIASVSEKQTIKSKTLEKYMALVTEKPQMEKALLLMKDTRKADNLKLIEAQTPSLAAAFLQNEIKVLITSRGGAISSERVAKPEDIGSFRVINVSVDALVPDLRALIDILYSIETRTPFLVVRELDARNRDYRDPRDLTVKLDVSGLTQAK